MESKVYSVKDVMEMLDISRTKAYEFIRTVYQSENPPFRVLKVNENYRVIRTSFDKWIGINE